MDSSDIKTKKNDLQNDLLTGVYYRTIGCDSIPFIVIKLA